MFKLPFQSIWERVFGSPQGSLEGEYSLNLDFALSKYLDPRVSFTRASSGTYFDAAGVMQVTPVNLLVRSEEFDNASWLKQGTATVTANTAVSPVGTTTADTLNLPAASDRINPSAVTASGGALYTFSVWLAGAGTVNITLASSGGTYTAVTQAVTLTPVLTRYSVTITTHATNTGLFAVIGRYDGFIGTGTATAVTAWGAQLETGSSATPYIRTEATSSGAPRFDHDPSTLVSKGLLIEEARTNSVRNNTMVGAVAGTPGTLPTNWTTTGPGIGTLTRTIVGTGVLNGITYIDVRYSGTTSTTGFNMSYDTTTGIDALTGQTWTNSAWVSLLAGSQNNITQINLGISERTAAGAIVTSGTIPLTLTSVFSRSSYARTLSGGGTVGKIEGNVGMTFSSGVAIDITLRIGLPQLEQGAFATSVIPTSGSALTRAADVASMTGTNFSSWFNASEGSFVAVASNFDDTATRNSCVVSVDDNTSNERMLMRRNTDSDRYTFSVFDGGVQQVNIEQGSNSWTVNTTQRLAFSYKLNDFASCYNGNTPLVDSTGTLPTPTQLQIGAGPNSQIWNGHIARLTYYPTRLSNTVLQGLSL